MRSPAGPAQGTISAEELSAIPEACRPRALGPVPRLGLGSRTTVLGWPAVFGFLSGTGVFANAIQNSVARELMPLDMLNDDVRPSTFLPGSGPVPMGHTGSTIEGLLQWGMLSAAKAGYHGPGFGADADHLPIYEPGSDQWGHTLRLARCSREYSHFTLDIGAIIDWNQKPVSRLANVQRAIADAVQSIREVREGRPFDLEISLDESPEGISPDAAATTPEEMSWLLEKLAAGGIAVGYVAPHLGFTKGSDVADHERLTISVERLGRVAGEHSALLSIHSGDYLSSATRKVLGNACSGKLLFKVSPALQDIYVNAVLFRDPALASRWKAWTLEYADRHGCRCESQAEAFHKYAFAAFGVRNDAGSFEMRELLYGAADSVKEAFNRDLARYLQLLYDDLMIG